jgi:signal transduction histidine kinase
MAGVRTMARGLPYAGTLTTLRRWIGPYAPPFRRREFWVVQALIIAIALVHLTLEGLVRVDLGDAHFVPVSLFLLPVIYAGLTFGLRGSGPTALWCALISIPNILFLHEGLARLAEGWQAALVVAVGIFVGYRADRERGLRYEAEARERERHLSEEKYRRLFASVSDATLLLGRNGVIHEANAAATELLGRSADALRDRSLGEIAPAELVAAILGPAPRSLIGPLALSHAETWIEPVCIDMETGRGGRMLLAQLRDVTLEVEQRTLAESYARQTLLAREEERRQIARDLHDGPLQSLMLLWQKFDLAEQTDAGVTPAALLDARRTAETVADELRQFSRDLRPSVLDDLGLVPALKAEVTAFRRRADVTVRLSANPPPRRLPPEVELMLLRICQEALRNIERHAAARRVSLRFSVNATEVKLTIADDGIGLGPLASPSQLVAQGRLGIVGMQERARLVGGSCTVRNGTHSGTVVEITTPLRRRADA